MPTIICRRRREGEEPLYIGVGPDYDWTIVTELPPWPDGRCRENHEEGLKLAAKLTAETGELHVAMTYP